MITSDGLVALVFLIAVELGIGGIMYWGGRRDARLEYQTKFKCVSAGEAWLCAKNLGDK